MNKSDLIRLISRRVPVKQDIAKDVVDAVFMEIEIALKNGEEINLKEFGRFMVNVIPEHMGRNPFLQQEMFIPEKKKVKFKPAPALNKIL